jgi:hypothetical protein
MMMAQPQPVQIDIQVSVAHVPGDPTPRVVIVMGADSVALRLEDAVRMAGLVLDACEQIRSGTPAKKAILQ